MMFDENPRGVCEDRTGYRVALSAACRIRDPRAILQTVGNCLDAEPGDAVAECDRKRCSGACSAARRLLSDDVGVAAKPKRKRMIGISKSRFAAWRLALLAGIVVGCDDARKTTPDAPRETVVVREVEKKQEKSGSVKVRVNSTDGIKVDVETKKKSKPNDGN